MSNDVIFGSVMIGAVVVATAITGLYRGRGRVREITNEYSGQYLGRSLVVRRANVRWGCDRYWVEIEGRDRITAGRIVTDDKTLIEITDDPDSVRIKNPDRAEQE